jgi:hypothetical protein
MHGVLRVILNSEFCVSECLVNQESQTGLRRSVIEQDIERHGGFGSTVAGMATTNSVTPARSVEGRTESMLPCTPFKVAADRALGAAHLAALRRLVEKESD